MFSRKGSKTDSVLWSTAVGGKNTELISLIHKEFAEERETKVMFLGYNEAHDCLCVHVCLGVCVNRASVIFAFASLSSCR